jgi:hypothetical protein
MGERSMSEQNDKAYDADTVRDGTVMAEKHPAGSGAGCWGWQVF